MIYLICLLIQHPALRLNHVIGNGGILVFHRDYFPVACDDLMFKSRLNVEMFHHTCPESDAESGILPVLPLNQMTDSNLMEASLSKQTQYTPPLWDPLHTEGRKKGKRKGCLESTGIVSRGPFRSNLYTDRLCQETYFLTSDLAPAWEIDIC